MTDHEATLEEERDRYKQALERISNAYVPTIDLGLAMSQTEAMVAVARTALGLPMWTPVNDRPEFRDYGYGYGTA